MFPSPALEFVMEVRVTVGPAMDVGLTARDVPEQYVAVGWVGNRLYSVIFEVCQDEEGEFLHLITLWKSTKEEVRLYEENS